MSSGFFPCTIHVDGIFSYFFQNLLVNVSFFCLCFHVCFRVSLDVFFLFFCVIESVSNDLHCRAVWNFTVEFFSNVIFFLLLSVPSSCIVYPHFSGLICTLKQEWPRRESTTQSSTPEAFRCPFLIMSTLKTCRLFILLRIVFCNTDHRNEFWFFGLFF